MVVLQESQVRMSINSETTSSHDDWENVDKELMLLQEIEEQRYKLSLYEEDTAMLIKENDRLRESGQKLREEIEAERRLSIKYKKEVVQLRGEVEKLKGKDCMDTDSKEEGNTETEETANEKHEVVGAAREKLWMKLAMHDLKSANREIEETTAKLFKSFAQQEDMAKRKALPCIIRKVMKQLESFEKECKKYMNGISKWNKKQLKSARAMGTKTAVTHVTDIDDVKQLPDLPKEVIEFLDKRLGEHTFSTYNIPLYTEYLEKSMLPNYRLLEKIGDQGFYKETHKFKDGEKIVWQWRPDNVLRDGVRAVLEDDKMNLYCISGKLLRTIDENGQYTYCNYI